MFGNNIRSRGINCQMTTYNNEQMQSILMDLFWRYTGMAEDANIPDLEERFNIISLCTAGRNLSAEKKLPIDKGNRWIGYIQGILIAKGITTIQAERDYTRSMFEGYYKRNNIEYRSLDVKFTNL